MTLWRYTFDLLVITFFLIGCSAENKNASQPAIKSPKAEPAELNTDSIPIFKDQNVAQITSYLVGKFDPAEHVDFVEVSKDHADRAGLYLRKDTYDAFKRMYKQALRDSITLVIRSATRNFDQQKDIWERKWTGQTILSSGQSAADISSEKQRCLEILKYSSMPGTSRHHWGTDIDLNAFNNQYFSSGEGKKVYDWLVKYAHQFGFCQPYTAKGSRRPYGYEEEKWHWSYLPVSGPLLILARKHLADPMIAGFAGADQAPSIQVKERYVLGIDPGCSSGNQ